MKALFIGGTGLISCAVSKLAIERGWELTLLNRGQRTEFVPAKAEVVQIDYQNQEEVKAFLNGKSYDVVVQWIGFMPERVEKDVELYLGKTKQYIFISSGAAYERPMKSPYVTESMALNNRYWQYGRNKRMCEDVLIDAYRAKEFPFTVVRPSLTYGDTQIPFAMGSWNKPWSLVQRMLDGKPIVCHGDGTSLWTMTHNSDFAKGFVGLMGRPEAIGEAYHIVSDELLTWDQIAYAIGDAAGVKPEIVHMSADQIARFIPGELGDLLGDKSSSCIYDCTKIKRLVPDFVCTTPFAIGVRQSVEYFRKHPEIQLIDEEWNEAIDALIEADKLVYPKKK
ncbi:MAG: NAD-dependent epimerase/dehydratase family protein [Christensenellaceae bacterium]|jgi:nucleoside-diphosphate-sugar epimerase|nr:NAD-dependent epimerase/dehydratase family protein [Christensenellaceae bacterium]